MDHDKWSAAEDRTHTSRDPPALGEGQGCSLHPFLIRDFVGGGHEAILAAFGRLMHEAAPITVTTLPI
jgi:hypothetical protein